MFFVFQVSAFISNDLLISMTGVSNFINRSSETQNLGWALAAPTRLTINSTSPVPGTFYCQYFAFTGELLPTTTAGPTTVTQTTPSTVGQVTSTAPVITTTKGAFTGFGAMELLILLFSVFLYRLF